VHARAGCELAGPCEGVTAPGEIGVRAIFHALDHDGRKLEIVFAKVIGETSTSLVVPYTQMVAPSSSLADFMLSALCTMKLVPSYQ